jgi:integrase
MPKKLEKRITADGKTVSWRARVRVTTPDGPRWASRTFEKQGEAKAWISEAEGRRRRGKAVEASREPLGKYLRRWLDDIAAPTIRPNTLAQYRWNLDRYIIPVLGGLPLAELSAGDIAAVYSGMRDRGLSERSVKLTHAVLRRALRWAVSDGLLWRNPADAVELPRRRRTEKRAMNPDEARAFVEAAAETRHGCLFTVLLLTGMRPSEAFALRWGDLEGLDGPEPVANVRRALVRYVERSDDGPSRSGWRFDEPKTEAGRRVVPLAPALVPMLTAQRAEVAKRRLKAGSAWQDFDLIFTGEDGGPLDVSSIRRQFAKVCASAGLADVETLPARARRGAHGPMPKPRTKVKPWFTLYSLRHTAASLLARAGTAPKVAAAILGHADVSTTLSVYTHSARDLERTAAGALADVVNLSPQEGPTEGPFSGSDKAKAAREDG